MAAPLEDADYHILRALWHLGRKFTEEDGFWIQTGDVAKWLEANKCFEKPMSANDVGKNMVKMRFKTKRRIGKGIFRWISRKKLMNLIEEFNDTGDIKEIEEQQATMIKLEVFKTLLDGGDLDELTYEVSLIQKAVKEFNALTFDDAKRWVEEQEA